MTRFYWLSIGAVVLVLTGLLPVEGMAFNRYNGNGSQACVDCHDSFPSFGALHTMHGNMTATCTNCHGTIGDNPKVRECAGCHVAEGLRLHHANSSITVCATCHPNDATPVGENVPPPLYGDASVNLTDPCLIATGAGGEDYDGDSKGLDNDGDLVYDANDVDCGGTPVEETTWGRIKALYM